MQDLAFIDPDDKTPLESVIKYYSHQLVEVYSHDKLDKLLELFKHGRSHMVLVVEIVSEVSLAMAMIDSGLLCPASG